MTPTIQKLIEEFEEKAESLDFGHSFEMDGDALDEAIGILKSFLTSSLLQVRKETVEEVKEKLLDDDCLGAYRQEVLTLLNSIITNDKV